MSNNCLGYPLCDDALQFLRMVEVPEGKWPIQQEGCSLLVRVLSVTSKMSLWGEWRVRRENSIDHGSCSEPRAVLAPAFESVRSLGKARLCPFRRRRDMYVEIDDLESVLQPTRCLHLGSKTD